MSLFLDTNIVVHAFDRSDRAKQQIAQTLLDSTERLVVSTQVLLETWWVLTRKLAMPLDEQTAAEVIRELSLLPVVQADTALVTRAIEAARRWQLTVWDGMIIEAARSAACSQVLTEDLQHGQDFEGITIENPFARD